MDYDKAHIQTYLHEFVEICHARLQACLSSIHDQQPVSYLRSRGIIDKALLREFKVGYFDELPLHADSKPRTGDLERRYKDVMPLLTKHSPERQALDPGVRAETPCLYGPGLNHLFHKRLVFPVYDADGGVVNLYGRSIEESNPFRHVYGSTRWSWYNIGRGELKNAKTLILTESIIDALTFVYCGIPTVTSLCAGPYRYGPSISHDQRIEFMNAGLVDALKRSTAVRIIYICFDKDANFAGDIQAVSLAKILVESGFDVKLLHLPPGEDPNSLFQKSGGTQVDRKARFLEYFTGMMDAAGDFIMEEALLEIDRLNLSEAQAKAVRQLIGAVSHYYSRSDEKLLDVVPGAGGRNDK